MGSLPSSADAALWTGGAPGLVGPGLAGPDFPLDQAWYPLPDRSIAPREAGLLGGAARLMLACCCRGHGLHRRRPCCSGLGPAGPEAGSACGFWEWRPALRTGASRPGGSLLQLGPFKAFMA